MRNRRLPPYAIPIATFFGVGVLSAYFRGTLTLKDFLISVVVAAVIILTITQMNHGPYI